VANAVALAPPAAEPPVPPAPPPVLAEPPEPALAAMAATAIATAAPAVEIHRIFVRLTLPVVTEEGVRYGAPAGCGELA
jgi:hypothetical protein